MTRCSAWSVAAKLALEYVAGGHLVPTLRAGGPGKAIAHWRIARVDDGGSLRWRRLSHRPRMLCAETRTTRRCGPPRICSRPSSTRSPTAAPELPVPGAAHREKARRTDWRQDWVTALTGADPVVAAANDSQIDDLGEVGGTAGQRRRHRRCALCVRLRPRRCGGGGGSADPVAAGDTTCTAADDPSLMVPASRCGRAGPRSGAPPEDPQEALVRGLAEAARLFPPIDASLSERQPVGLDLTPEQAAEFLTHGAAALGAAGLGVVLPAELTAKGARRLRARLRVGQPVTDPGAGIVEGGLSSDGLRQFRWEAAIGDDALSPEEFAEIVALKQPLVLWKGQWVRLDSDDLPEAGRPGRPHR